MGVRNASVSSNTLVATTIVTTAETVMLTTPPINQPIDNALILLFWEVEISLSAASTAVQFRIRRGTTTSGTLVNALSNTTVTAATVIRFCGHYIDTPGIVAGQQWSLSAAVLSASGNSTVQDGCISALVL
jgi:hypothetical protein